MESSITNYHNRVQPNIFYCIAFTLHAAREIMECELSWQDEFTDSTEGYLQQK